MKKKLRYILKEARRFFAIAPHKAGTGKPCHQTMVHHATACSPN